MPGMLEANIKSSFVDEVLDEQKPVYKVNNNDQISEIASPVISCDQALNNANPNSDQYNERTPQPFHETIKTEADDTKNRFDTLNLTL